MLALVFLVALRWRSDSGLMVAGFLSFLFWLNWGYQAPVRYAPPEVQLLAGVTAVLCWRVSRVGNFLHLLGLAALSHLVASNWAALGQETAGAPTPLARLAILCLCLLPAALAQAETACLPWLGLLLAGPAVLSTGWGWLIGLGLLLLAWHQEWGWEWRLAGAGLLVAWMAVNWALVGYVLRGGLHRSEDLRRDAYLAALKPGHELPAEALSRSLPSEFIKNGRAYFPPLPQAELKVTPAELDWLVVSNNPEFVKSTPVVLLRGQVPAGRGRFFISHFNATTKGTEVVLRLSRPVRWLKQGYSIVGGFHPDIGVQTWQSYLDSSPGGEGLEIRHPANNHFRNAVLMLDLKVDEPLGYEVAMVEEGAPFPEGLEVTPLYKTQPRGIFLQPDRYEALEFELGGGQIRAATVMEDHLRGLDGERDEVLKGNYGAVSHLNVTLKPDPEGNYRRVVGLLLARGGQLWTVVDGECKYAATHGAVVVLNQEVVEETEWSYDYTLPANSYAPVSLILIPVPR